MNKEEETEWLINIGLNRFGDLLGLHRRNIMNILEPISDYLVKKYHLFYASIDMTVHGFDSKNMVFVNDYKKLNENKTIQQILETQKIKYRLTEMIINTVKNNNNEKMKNWFKQYRFEYQ